MNTEELITQARRIVDIPRERPIQLLSEASEFLRAYAGEGSDFYRQISALDHRIDREVEIVNKSKQILNAFIRYVENGLLGGRSIVRKAQLEVVSDFLAQAQSLLITKEIHPAAAAVLIGASLEEFLRNWVDELGLWMEGDKTGIDAYARKLRQEDILTAQDMKDITAWAGLRNLAAHGDWGQVADEFRVHLMLEGVNLFMRKYSRL